MWPKKMKSHDERTEYSRSLISSLQFDELNKYCIYTLRNKRVRSLCPAPNTAEQSEFDCPLNEGSQPQVRGPVLVRRSFDNGPHWGHSEKNYFSFTYFLHSSVISLYFFM